MRSLILVAQKWIFPSFFNPRNHKITHPYRINCISYNLGGCLHRVDNSTMTFWFAFSCYFMRKVPKDFCYPKKKWQYINQSIIWVMQNTCISLVILGTNQSTDNNFLFLFLWEVCSLLTHEHSTNPWIRYVFVQSTAWAVFLRTARSMRNRTSDLVNFHTI